MSISEDKKVHLKRALNYLFFSLFLIVFNLIYSIFAHGISSNYMTYAFLIPLIGGTLISALQIYLPKVKTVLLQLWQMGLITLVIGNLLHGVFDIYGTEVALVNVFFVLGSALLIVCFTLYFVSLIRKTN